VNAFKTTKFKTLSSLAVWNLNPSVIEVLIIILSLIQSTHRLVSTQILQPTQAIRSTHSLHIDYTSLQSKPSTVYRLCSLLSLQSTDFAVYTHFTAYTQSTGSAVYTQSTDSSVYTQSTLCGLRKSKSIHSLQSTGSAVYT
jgi:hypothetical protein